PAPPSKADSDASLFSLRNSACCKSPGAVIVFSSSSCAADYCFSVAVRVLRVLTNIAIRRAEAMAIRHRNDGCR
ncbi:hypothetical protein, partial [Mesorhizobium sp. M7A.F.Ca.CA.004.12.1.1]|uniref:hypothetical protein n=1 Tax=Mesorhizobium sp. M7A.F.Ca.CA.004.12.1.1 TaxID=2496732 RepID=UPI0019D022E6